MAVIILGAQIDGATRTSTMNKIIKGILQRLSLNTLWFHCKKN